MIPTLFLNPLRTNNVLPASAGGHRASTDSIIYYLLYGAQSRIIIVSPSLQKSQKNKIKTNKNVWLGFFFQVTEKGAYLSSPFLVPVAIYYGAPAEFGWSSDNPGPTSRRRPQRMAMAEFPIKRAIFGIRSRLFAINTPSLTVVMDMVCLYFLCPPREFSQQAKTWRYARSARHEALQLRGGDSGFLQVFFTGAGFVFSCPPSLAFFFAHNASPPKIPSSKEDKALPIKTLVC